MPKGANVRGLLTVVQDAEFAVLIRRGEGAPDSIHLLVTEGGDGFPLLRSMEVGPFDTGLDVATWLLRQCIDLKVLKPM